MGWGVMRGGCMGQDGVGRDGTDVVGWDRMVAGTQLPSSPIPPPCPAHHPQQRKPFLFSPTSPALQPGNAIGRESRGCASLPVLRPSLPRLRCRGGRGAGSPCAGLCPGSGTRGMQEDTCCLQPNICPWQELLPQTQP